MRKKTIEEKMVGFSCACNAGGYCGCYEKEEARLKQLEFRKRTRNYEKNPTRKQLYNLLTELSGAAEDYLLYGKDYYHELKEIIEKANKVKS